MSKAGETPPKLDITIPQFEFRNGLVVGLSFGFLAGYAFGLFLMKNAMNDPLAEQRRRVIEGPPKGHKIDPEAKRRVQDMKFDDIIRNNYEELPQIPEDLKEDE